MNRGSMGILRRIREPPGCFNEAPIHESGKWETAMGPRGSSRRFNEAPIHESGKCREASRDARTGWGFNEAPIHESGKFGVARSSSLDVAPASMRPRFMNRGSPHIRYRIWLLREGFNEAPIHESGKLLLDRERRRSVDSFNEAPIHESGKCYSSETTGAT